MKIFMLNRVEHEKSFITSGPSIQIRQKQWYEFDVCPSWKIQFGVTRA